ncbi:MAG: FecR domain-containing protein [Planctomycetales bacterium]|nr:FecR domain-containing protein [Planctomycetales bacterium]
MSESKFDEFDSLLFDWEDGSIDDVGLERIRALLRTDKEIRQHFVRASQLSAVLRLVIDSQDVQPEPTAVIAGSDELHSLTNARDARALGSRQTDQSPTAANRNTWQSLLAFAAGIAICFMTMRWAYLESASTDSEKKTASVGNRNRVEEATSSGIAIVSRLIDVEWSAIQHEIGDALTPGSFAIQSGFAQIEFFCGATVVLEGPGELILDSVESARLIDGRVRAQVPPAARGFSIQAGELRVVDLGTEFGVAVSSSGPNVQVFDGEVELHQPDARMEILKTGEARASNIDGYLAAAKASSESFTGIAGLETRFREQKSKRFQEWKSFSQSLRNDHRLLVYYTFSDESTRDRKLANSAASTVSQNPRELDGAIVGAVGTSGRWPEKSGLSFKQPSDRVRVHIPGEFGSLTFACWVKIDSLDRWYNSLFLTDNYQQGEPHWQILDTGQLFFSVRVSKADGGPEHREVLSRPFWNPTLSGKWLHLATTYDVDRQRVTHYLNGQELGSEDIPDSQLVKITRIGTASIGNWSAPTKPDQRFAIRNLNGSIDELAIFAAALSTEDIQRIYKNGRP